MHHLRNVDKRSNVGPQPIPTRFIIKKEQLRGIKDIGYGVGVTVQMATWRKNNGEVQEVAMKKFHLRSESTRYREAFYNEAKLLLKLKHRNIVQFYGVCTEDMLAIVMEKAEIRTSLEGVERICHSLKDLLEEYQQYTLPFGFKILALHHVCKGLEYLHSKNIVHNDLKSANVLVFNEENDDIIFKICDFGEYRKDLDNLVKSTTSELDPDKAEAKKTAPFTSPERFRNSKLVDRRSDIYALGVLMYEVLRHDLDFPWQEELNEIVYADIKEKVLKGERPGFKKHDDSQLDLHLVKNLENIIEYCWQQNFKDRPHIEQVLDLVSLLQAQTNKTAFLNGIEEENLKSIYEELFDDPSLAYQFVKEVCKWNKDTVTSVAKYFDKIIQELNDREKKFNIIDLTADSVTVVSGIAGIVGFGLLFNPITFIPGVALCATAGVLGGGGGLTNASVMVHKKRKDKEAKDSVKEEFKKAGVDIDALTLLVNRICALANDLSKEFPSYNLEKCFSAIHGFLLRTWGILRNIATNDLVIRGIQNILNVLNINLDMKCVADQIALTHNILSSINAEAITGLSVGMSVKSIYQVFDATADATSGAVATVNTFGALAKSAQVLQSVGLIFSVVSVAAGIYGVVKNAQKLDTGSKSDVAEMFKLYQTAMKNFWRIKVITDPRLDQ